MHEFFNNSPPPFTHVITHDFNNCTLLSIKVSTKRFQSILIAKKIILNFYQMILFVIMSAFCRRTICFLGFSSTERAILKAGLFIKKLFGLKVSIFHESKQAFWKLTITQKLLLFPWILVEFRILIVFSFYGFTWNFSKYPRWRRKYSWNGSHAIPL